MGGRGQLPSVCVWGMCRVGFGGGVREALSGCWHHPSSLEHSQAGVCCVTSGLCCSLGLSFPLCQEGPLG